jgi:hypothetical protein
MAARGSWAALTAATALLLVGAAAAATPQQTSQRIFADLADNGRLDGKYTRAQIDRALHTPSLRGYEVPTRPVPIRRPVSVRSAEPSAEASRRLSLPFSGIDLALLGAVGAPILLLGASLGRFARVRPRVRPEGGPG